MALIDPKILTLIMGMTITAPFSAIAQDTPPPNEAVEIITKAPLKKRKIIRKVEPVPYWVEADQLRIRDNPVAGDVIGMLELGQKVKAYDQFENWIRISKNEQTAKWINVDYLTNTAITWARFGNEIKRRSLRRAGLREDVSLKRIKVPGDKTARIYLASVHESANGNRIIVTRQNFRAGPYFQKRLVACSDQTATHMQILGEGYTYIMMESDIRGTNIDVNTASPSVVIAQDESLSPFSIAIANYSCQNTSGLLP